MHEVERRMGAPPHDPESFSLWLTSLAPLAERDKLALLTGTDTIQRLTVVMDSLDSMEERMRNHPVNRVASYISSWVSGFVGSATAQTAESTEVTAEATPTSADDDLDNSSDSDSDSSRSSVSTDSDDSEEEEELGHR